MKGLISNLQHFSVGDGPGIRSTVFMQGCNLRCPWCHNPETISLKPVLLYYENLCTGCRACVKACPTGAHTFLQKHEFNPALCALNGKCANNCPSGALRLSGKEMTVEEVMSFILEDEAFYEASGGGVTFSGGEPLLQPDFVAAAAKECKAHDIHVIVDTAGNVSFSAFEKVQPFVGTFFIDVKAANEDTYKSITGGSLDLVLRNMKALADKGCDVVARIPIIPGINDTETACDQIASLIKETGVKKVDLLPFHRLGSGKYTALFKDYPYKNATPPKKEEINLLKGIFQKNFITQIE